MRRYLFFITLSLVSGLFSYAQFRQDAPAPRPFVGVSAASHAPSMAFFRDRNSGFYNEELYNINGVTVLGTPYLHRGWQTGSLTTSDGRAFTGYKLRYDAFHQTVYFLSGKDSLEVSDPIKQFTLMVAYADTTVKSTFVNGNQYQKIKKPVFYEVLLDNTKGQLLKANKKVVKEATDALPIHEGKKIFDLESTYYYFDRSTKKLGLVKSNPASLATLLMLDVAAAQELNRHDLSKEEDLIAFFETYFKKSY